MFFFLFSWIKKNIIVSFCGMNLKFTLTLLPFLCVPVGKKKGWKHAQQTKASREIHLLKKEDQQEGACVKEKAERGASVTTDHYILAWHTTNFSEDIFKGKTVLSLKMSSRKVSGKTENLCYYITEKIALRACNTSMFPLDIYQWDRKQVNVISICCIILHFLLH